MRTLCVCLISLVLVSCATAVGTSYGPADQKGFGYTDTRIESDRFRITFSGDGATPVDVVEDYALLRAAELTLENEYEWFRIVARDVAREDKGGVGVGAGVGSGSYGRRGGVGVNVGGNLGTIGSKRFFTVRMEVLLGRGDIPDDGEVYSAQAVIDSIGSRLAPTEPQ